MGWTVSRVSLCTVSIARIRPPGLQSSSPQSTWRPDQQGARRYAKIELKVDNVGEGSRVRDGGAGGASVEGRARIALEVGLLLHEVNIHSGSKAFGDQAAMRISQLEPYTIDDPGSAAIMKFSF
jgi:hypothetical protein